VSRMRRCSVVNVPHAQRAGIGQFAGHVDPQDPTHAVVAELAAAMGGDPALRLAPQMAHRGRVLTSTNHAVQKFVRFSDQTNSQEALEAMVTSPLKRNRSRALGQFRGTPDMT
jgi:hypothetical protein